MKVTVGEAVELIKEGNVVAFPTETVYGLGADVYNVNAVKKSFDIKGRPSDNPLIVHISNLDQLKNLTDHLPEHALKLADHFWPGPLTLVLNKSKEVPDIVTGGLSTVAIRMPNHKMALDLINQTCPLTAPSANRSGKPSPTRPEHIISDYADSLPYIDGGVSEVGLESTVLDLTGKPTILRPGLITDKMIADVLQESVKSHKHQKNGPLKSPGTKYTHYKPLAAIHWLEAMPQNPTPEHYYILNSENKITSAENIYSYEGDFRLLARNLYDHFRDADFKGCTDIFIENIPKNLSHPAASALVNRINKAIGA